MTENKQLTQKDITTGDAAVDGLSGGVVAGVLMAAYLVIVGLALGEGPGALLGRFTANGAASPLVGALSHLAASAVYGALFGAGWHLVAARWRRTRWLTVLASLAYSIALLTIAQALILPASDSPLQEVPLVHWALAHGVYGLVLGFLISRRREA